MVVDLIVAEEPALGDDDLLDEPISLRSVRLHEADERLDVVDPQGEHPQADGAADGGLPDAVGIEANPASEQLLGRSGGQCGGLIHGDGGSRVAANIPEARFAGRRFSTTSMWTVCPFNRRILPK